MSGLLRDSNSKLSILYSILVVIFLLLLCILIPSLIHVGTRSVFDVDELFHLNSAYQMRIGQLPYKDFLFPYSPLLQWMLMPFIVVSNPVWSMEVARILLISFFVIRIALTVGISIAILGVPFGLLAVIGILIDPITSFSAMQVRPDGIAVFFQTVILLLFLLIKKYSRHTILYVFYGMATIFVLFASLKLVPFVVGLYVVFWITEQSLLKAYWKWIALGVGSAAVGLLIYPVSNGLLGPMIHQMVIDAKAINDSLLYPLNILNFYWPTNPLLYGSGVQYGWYYSLFIPLCSVAAWALLFFGNESQKTRVTLFTISIPAIFQFGSLLFVRSVFIQYHLASNWLLIILSVWFLKRMWIALQQYHRVFQYIFIFGATITLFVLINNVTTIYEARAKEVNTSQISSFVSLWKHIPSDTKVFPGFLWRQSGSFLGYGWNLGDLPLTLRNSLIISTEEGLAGISYVYLSDTQKQYLSSQLEAYIDKNFTKSSTMYDIWVRK